MKNVTFIFLTFIILVFTIQGIYADDVEKGKVLFNDTSLSTNGKSCNTCHTNGKDIDGNKKTFTILGEDLGSIEDAVNFCIINALSGKPLEKESNEMKNMVSYIRTLTNKKRITVTPGY